MISTTGSPTSSIELDWRFAELVADTWVEPELALRYAADPVAMLAEYGMAVAASDAPALPVAPDIELIIEDFCGADAEFPAVPICLICSKDEPSVAAVATAG